MTLYYSLVFLLLVMEMTIFMLLIIPLPFTWRRKLFTFISESPLIAKLQYGMKITFIFILILFIDSVNRVYRVQIELAAASEKNSQGRGTVLGHERMEVQARKFYSQRNMYLCGFTLFLSLILNRTYVMILDVLRLEDKVKRYERDQKAGSKDSTNAGEIASLRKQLTQKDRDMEALKKQSEGLSREYGELSDRYSKLEGIDSTPKKDNITSFDFIQRFFWSNAGFDSLKHIKELDEYEPRYDPTVIPLEEPSAPAPSSYTAPNPSYKPPIGSDAGRYYSVSDFHALYKSGEVTPIQVVEALLPLIRRDVSPPGAHSIAFLESKVDIIRKAAEASALRYREGRSLGLLDGIPVAVKDEVDVDGYRRSMGTSQEFIRADRRTAWCIRKWEEEGAIVIGKTNMHELGLDTTNNNPTLGTPHNPFNENYYTGGSSGGSAYAVSAGLVPIALGLDGGGSIRIPSSFCGVYGLKTSHGRVSQLPGISSASTTGVSGPIASTMEALEIAYRVMAQSDPDHPSSALFAVPRPLRQKEPRKKLLGIYNDWFNRADAPVLSICRAALDYYTKTLGYTPILISIPYIPESQTAHAVTILSEIASTTTPSLLSHLSAPSKVLVSVASKTPASAFLRAQRMRHLLMQHLASLFAQFPGLIIVTPTSPIAGWHIEKGDLGHGLSDGDKSIRSIEFASFANLTGVPALSIPVGYAEPVEGEGKVPVGLMGMGEWGGEEGLIEWGKEGEDYLNGMLEGGRLRPGGWVDVLKVSGGAEGGA
ncbi:MAG: hypothetical protein M1840_007986 [Geoglossum simile]|nr:MAG: hypothetical protein M1840_007986 [Geoglossum simile]